MASKYFYGGTHSVVRRMGTRLNCAAVDVTVAQAREYAIALLEAAAELEADAAVAPLPENGLCQDCHGDMQETPELLLYRDAESPYWACQWCYDARVALEAPESRFQPLREQLEG